MDQRASSVDAYPADDRDDMDSAEIEEARAQIEHTRSEMGQTIDAIKEKLNPQHLIQEAKETIHDATIGRAQEAVGNAVETAKEAVSSAVDAPIIEKP